jgi:hypothetical protein
MKVFELINELSHMQAGAEVRFRAELEDTEISAFSSDSLLTEVNVEVDSVEDCGDKVFLNH